MISRLNKLAKEKAEIQTDVFESGTRVHSEDLPLPLRDLYSIANGQNEALPPIFLRYKFSSADSVFQNKQLLDAQARAENWPGHWWSPTWYPFAEDIIGDYLVLDSKTQRIIEFLHDDGERPVVAASIRNLLMEIIAGLESGRLNYDLELGLIDIHAQEKIWGLSARSANIEWRKVWLSFLCFDLNELLMAFGSPGFILSWAIETLAILIYIGIFTLGIMVCNELRFLFD